MVNKFMLVDEAQNRELCERFGIDQAKGTSLGPLVTSGCRDRASLLFPIEEAKIVEFDLLEGNPVVGVRMIDGNVDSVEFLVPNF